MTALVTVVVLAAFQASPAAPPAAPAGQAPAPAVESADKPWPPPGVLRVGPGVTPPKMLARAKPVYPASAMAARITGEVRLEAVVAIDGRVTETRITRSLDKVHGLDEEARKAVLDFRFEPATKDGVAVPVVVAFEMEFNMRDRPATK
jgi:vitamin B12 transporter